MAITRSMHSGTSAPSRPARRSTAARNYRRRKSRTTPRGTVVTQARADDVSVVSDNEAPASTEVTTLKISPRTNDFTERTWWLVDLEMDGITQGATALVKRCMKTYNWDLAKCRKVLNAYRQFLTLKKELKDWDATVLSPCLAVDQMWHQHILDVVNYYHDMILLCGHVVGHNPDGALDMEAKVTRDKTTREALEKKFGEYDKEIWDPQLAQGAEEDNSNVNPDIEMAQGAAVNNSTGVNPNPNNDEAAGDNDHITLKFRDQMGTETSLRMTMTTPMRAAMRRYALLNRRKLSDLRVVIGGELVGDLDTPQGLHLQDQGIINVIMEQGPLVNNNNNNGNNNETTKCLTVIFRDMNGEEAHFKAVKFHPLSSVFESYAALKGVQSSSLAFILDGERIEPDSTPKMLEMEDFDIIGVMLRQCGC